MDFFVNILFAVIHIFDVKSSDPLVALQKSNKRNAIFCLMGLFGSFLFLGWSYLIFPSAHTGVLAVLIYQLEVISVIFFFCMVLVFSLGVLWFYYKYLDIELNPEKYL